MDIEISRERANGFRLKAQCLWPRSMDLTEALHASGWLPVRESAYLALAARVHDFDRFTLDKMVFEDKSWVELATLRGESFLLPAQMAATAIRCPAPRVEEVAEKTLEKAGVPRDVREALEAEVLRWLADGPMPPNDLHRRLLREEGQTSRWLESPEVMHAFVTLLRLGGRVVLTNVSGSLDVGQAVYMLTHELLPDEESGEITPKEALRRLAAYYFRVHGPATTADFGWWCGAGRVAVAEAFAAHEQSLVAVRVEGVPYRLYLPASRLEELREIEVPQLEPVSLVPWRDTWLSSHEGRVGRFVRREDLSRIVAGSALPAILVRGMVAGRWELAVASGEVTLHWFRTQSEGVEIRAKELAKEIGDFAALELMGTNPVSVHGPEGEVGIYS